MSSLLSVSVLADSLAARLTEHLPSKTSLLLYPVAAAAFAAAVAAVAAADVVSVVAADAAADAADAAAAVHLILPSLSEYVKRII